MNIKSHVILFMLSPYKKNVKKNFDFKKCLLNAILVTLIKIPFLFKLKQIFHYFRKSKGHEDV